MPAPYDELFIYELSGDARAASAGLGRGFLGLWLEEGDSFLFFSRPAEEMVAGLLAREPGLSLRQRHRLTYEQWQGGAGLEPLELSGLTVAPAWQAPKARGQPTLLLDPGLVFGSGLHPTTRHCLELLLLRARLGPLGRVLDLGCGTGILACAAALLGAESVWAVDLNPLCVATTRANARLNRLAVSAAEGAAAGWLSRPAGLVLANLHWGALEELLRRPAELADKQDLIISGVTRSHRAELERALARLGFGPAERREAEATWFSVWARREGSRS
jgi:ribosomal protein L11 methyltransferase